MKKPALIIIILLCLQTVALAQKGDAIVGNWLNPSGEDQIQIYKHGLLYFGKLAWVKHPLDEETGKPKLDKHNPDPALRSRPDLGLELLKGFTFNSDNTYTDGTIYDPKSGKTYSCKMQLDGNRLKIRGYVGISLFGRSEVWTRVK